MTGLFQIDFTLPIVFLLHQLNNCRNCTFAEVLKFRMNLVRFCKMHILCVRESVLKDPFRAQLRKEDVRATEKDKVEMYKCFRPGDVVLARVLSLGEASTGYIVTTAENELGVVLAYSETTGSKMVPVSWTEMQCPKSYAKEFRKIAKVIPESMADMAMS